MGFVRQEGKTASIVHEQAPHPDRVSWYAALIQEWTTQVPQVAAAVDGETVAAWIGPYSSCVGVRHFGSTQVWASSVEEAVEELCNFVYEDVQADAWRVLGSESWSGGR